MIVERSIATAFLLAILAANPGAFGDGKMCDLDGRER